MTLLLLSTADTDLLAARSVPEPALPLRLANPARTAAVDLDGVSLVLVRLLGGRRAWEGLDPLLADAAQRGVPVVALGGVTPDRIPECRDAGAAGIAVMGGLMRAPDPPAAARAFLAPWAE